MSNPKATKAAPQRGQPALSANGKEAAEEFKRSAAARATQQGQTSSERKAELDAFKRDLRRIAGISDEFAGQQLAIGPGLREIMPLLEDMQAGMTSTKKLRSIEGFVASQPSLKISLQQTKAILEALPNEHRHEQAIAILDSRLSPEAKGWASGQLAARQELQ